MPVTGQGGVSFSQYSGPFFWLTELDSPSGNTLTPLLGFVVQVGLSLSPPTHLSTRVGTVIASGMGTET